MSNSSKAAALYRAKEGAINELIEDAWEHYKAGGRESLLNAFSEAAQDAALRRYDVHIRNAFERAGIQFGEKLTAAELRDAIANVSGLELDGEGLSADAIVKAVDRAICKAIEKTLGVSVSTVMDAETLKQDLGRELVAAIQDGRAERIIGKALAWAIKRARARRENAEAYEALRKQQAAAAAKRYRRRKRADGFREVWR